MTSRLLASVVFTMASVLAAASCRGDILQAGGSNYVAVALDPDSLTTEASWKDNRLFHSPICALESFQEQIAADMKAMRAKGQKKLSLVLWHADTRSGEICNGFLANSGEAASVDHLARNVRELETLAASEGFDEVQVRFAPQWINNPETWSSWSEASFASNLNLIKQVLHRSATLPGLRISYDLSVELGGSASRFGQTYAERLWASLSAPERSGSAFGFSIAYQPGRLTRFLTWNLPNLGEAFEVDLYDGAYGAIVQLATEARAQGRNGFGLIIGETYYDDDVTRSDVTRASAVARVPIVYMMQWPLRRGFKGHISVPTTFEYEYFPTATGR